jgi:hypothetical protein
MIFKQKKDDVTDILFRHELQHVYQVKREGWLKFYLKYLWYSARFGYKKIPYELEAWKIQDTPLTLEERRLKDLV